MAQSMKRHVDDSELELSDETDDLDDDEREALHAALDRSLAQRERGERGRDAREALAEMRERIDRWRSARQ